MTDEPLRILASNGNYRTLLELANVIDKETNLQAVLRSLHKLLPAVVKFDTVAMLLLAKNDEALRLVAFERGSAGPHVGLGVEGPYAGTEAARAIQEQRTIYVPDIRQELSQIARHGCSGAHDRAACRVHGSNFYA